MYSYSSVLLNSSPNEKCFRQIRIENRNTHFMFNNFFFFENLAAYEIMRKNMVDPERLQMTVHHGECTLDGG